MFMLSLTIAPVLTAVFPSFSLPCRSRALSFCFPTYSNTVRKSIARVLTVMNSKARQNLRELYKSKKYLPLDLRAKRTRAIRRRLTPVSDPSNSPPRTCGQSAEHDSWHDMA